MSNRILRPLRTTAIFIGIGVVCNMVLAWTLALASNLQLYARASTFVGYGEATLASGHRWTYLANRSIGNVVIGSFVEPAASAFYWEEARIRMEYDGEPEFTLPMWATSRLPDYDLERDSLQTEVLFAAGWPWKSMLVVYRAELLGNTMDQGVSFEVKGRTGIAIEDSTNLTKPPQAIPLTPIWPGFIGNSILAAAILTMAVVVLRGVRRSVRIRRGQCPICGYIIYGGIDLCSECGWHRPQTHDAQ